MLKRLWKKIVSFFTGKKDKDEASSGNSFDYVKDLVWLYGGMDGSKAKIAAEIKDLKMDVPNKKMYYKWVSGGCEALGAANATEYKNTYACIFYWDAAQKKWIGGKFDEISTSRTWRPLANCTNYRGWKWQPFASAGKYAFLIISKNAKLRTNVIFS